MMNISGGFRATTTRRNGAHVSMFDNLKDQALGLAKDHKDTVENVAEQAVEKVGDLVDNVTGHKFASQIDAVQEQAPEQLGKLLGD